MSAHIGSIGPSSKRWANRTSRLWPLGRLLVIQDGQGPCLGRWQSTAPRERIQNSGSAVGLSDEDIVVTGTSVREMRLTSEDIARIELPEDAPLLQTSAQVCAVYAVGP